MEPLLYYKRRQRVRMTDTRWRKRKPHLFWHRKTQKK